MIVDPECKNRKNKPIVSELDEMILEEIRKLHADPAAFDKLREEAEEEDKAEPIAERLEEVEKQINRLLNLYQTGVVELEELQPRIADLKDERLRLSDRLQSVKEKEAFEGLRPGSGQGLPRCRCIRRSGAAPGPCPRFNRKGCN